MAYNRQKSQYVRFCEALTDLLHKKPKVIIDRAQLEGAMQEVLGQKSANKKLEVLDDQAGKAVEMVKDGYIALDVGDKNIAALVVAMLNIASRTLGISEETLNILSEWVAKDDRYLERYHNNEKLIKEDLASRVLFDPNDRNGIQEFVRNEIDGKVSAYEARDREYDPEVAQKEEEILRLQRQRISCLNACEKYEQRLETEIVNKIRHARVVSRIMVAAGIAVNSGMDLSDPKVKRSINKLVSKLEKRCCNLYVKGSIKWWNIATIFNAYRFAKAENKVQKCYACRGTFWDKCKAYKESVSKKDGASQESGLQTVFGKVIGAVSEWNKNLQPKMFFGLRWLSKCLDEKLTAFKKSNDSSVSPPKVSFWRALKLKRHFNKVQINKVQKVVDGELTKWIMEMSKAQKAQKDQEVPGKCKMIKTRVELQQKLGAYLKIAEEYKLAKDEYGSKLISYEEGCVPLKDVICSYIAWFKADYAYYCAKNDIMMLEIGNNLLGVQGRIKTDAELQQMHDELRKMGNTTLTRVFNATVRLDVDKEVFTQTNGPFFRLLMARGARTGDIVTKARDAFRSWTQRLKSFFGMTDKQQDFKPDATERQQVASADVVREDESAPDKYTKTDGVKDAAAELEKKSGNWGSRVVENVSRAVEKASRIVGQLLKRRISKTDDGQQNSLTAEQQEQNAIVIASDAGERRIELWKPVSTQQSVSANVKSELASKTESDGEATQQQDVNTNKSSLFKRVSNAVRNAVRNPKVAVNVAQGLVGGVAKLMFGNGKGDSGLLPVPVLDEEDSMSGQGGSTKSVNVGQLCDESNQTKISDSSNFDTVDMSGVVIQK